ncbi:MAG: carboxypeptidase-like regulatory domain-containing protein [Rhodothermales bacterium]
MRTENMYTWLNSSAGCRGVRDYFRDVRIFSVLLFALCISYPIVASSVQAQNRGAVSGIIYDAETETTLPGAHVYLANTTIGDITDANGFFHIKGVQAGSYQIIITTIGYKPYQQAIAITPDGNTDLTFKLQRDVYQVGEITVTDDKPRHWKRDLSRFKRMFLGITKNRRGCEIEDPFLLSFRTTDGRFTASTTAPLTIINRAMGYKITYHLNEFSAKGGEFRFTGQPVFELMPPKHKKEEKKWGRRRKEMFEGSFQHFLRSIAANTSYEDGFRLYLMDELNWKQPHTQLLDFYREAKAEIKQDVLLKEHPLPHERSMQFAGFLHVIYLEDMMERDFYEWVAMNYNASKEPMRAALRLMHTDANFNEIGFLNNAFDVARYGYWNWESGICNWLPFNYEME